MGKITGNSGAEPALISGLEPMHPGELLHEIVIPAVKATRNEIAAHLGMPRQRLNKLERGLSRVDAELALKLAKLFGSSGEYWMRLQANYDLAQARKAMASALDSIPALERTE